MTGKEMMQHFTKSSIVSRSTGMQACIDLHKTHGESPNRQPQKCSMIEKYSEVPFCVPFLPLLSIAAEEKKF